MEISVLGFERCFSYFDQCKENMDADRQFKNCAVYVIFCNLFFLYKASSRPHWYRFLASFHESIVSLDNVMRSERIHRINKEAKC